MPELKHRAATQRELAEIFDAIELDHANGFYDGNWGIDSNPRIRRLERALLLLRDELFNNPNREV
ncbi:MAG: hypothetical protein ACOH2H_15985 [Cypionkella sp.]